MAEYFSRIFNFWLTTEIHGVLSYFSISLLPQLSITTLYILLKFGAQARTILLNRDRDQQ